MKKKLLMSLLALSFVMVGCTAGDTSDSQYTKEKETDTASIHFNGSSTLAPVITEIASNFSDKYEKWKNVDSSFPDKPISIYVASGGSGQGISTLIDGTTDFGMVARQVKDDEKKSINDEKEYLVGIDALSIAVNPDSPLLKIKDNLTSDEVKDIFSGKYNTWKDFDSNLPDEEIVVVTRDISGGAHEVFQKNIMGDTEVSNKVIQAPTMGGLVEKIITNKNAIGYASYGVANQNKDKIVSLKLDGTECTEDNILNDSYKLQRPLLLVGSGENTSEEQAFLDEVLGDSGQKVVESQGFIKVQENE